MGVAHLQLGELDEAAEKLMLAEDLEPQNPVVHYYLGLLRLDQARQAYEWNDAMDPTIRFATYRPHLVAPNTRGMYELVAMQEFGAAIANAPYLDRGTVLMLHNQMATLTLIPVTANDLMVALGCDQFEGQAHNVLGAMFLERGAYDAAEEHMDAAADAGLAVVFGYADLGAAYERQGRHADAARAYLKGMENDPGIVRPMQKVLENFGKALLD
jgi:tetratricopeptide (TPR) repeat protein